MKKLIKFTSLVVVMTLVFVSTNSLGVFAEEVETDVEFVSNMDADTYRETRLAQINLALQEGKITQEQAALLITHVNDMAEKGTFGTGPSTGVKGSGNAECILGEGTNLGIFRSESAGQKSGNGNGKGSRLRRGDGTGTGNASNSRGKGQGNRG
jgi:hypothetical protein